MRVKDLPEKYQKEYYQTAAQIVDAYHKGMRALMQNYDQASKELWDSRLKAEADFVADLVKRVEKDKGE